MVRSLALTVALVTTACSTGPMTPCVSTATMSCVDQADRQGREVAGAVVIGIALIALAKIIYEVTPLAVAMHGHHG